MARFSERNLDRLDWQLLRDGAITLYYRRAIFDRDVRWLKDHGYVTVVIDCDEYERFCRQMSNVLRFKDHFGYEPWTGNLDALTDGLREVEVDPETGFAFCFLRFDRLSKSDAAFAHGVLDIIEDESRANLLFGRRLLALVQSEEATIYFSPVGARPVVWNVEERSNKSRGIE